MCRTPYVLCLIGLVFSATALAGSDNSAAASKQNKSTARKLHLPRGAVARLGSTPFQAWNSVTSIRYIDAGKKVLVGSVRGTSDGSSSFHLFDAANGKELRRWKIMLNYGTGINSYGDQYYVSPARWAVSTDGRLFAHVEEKATEETAGHLLIEELASGKLLFEVNEKKGTFTHVQFTHDGKYLAAIFQKTPEKKNLPAQQPQLVTEDEPSPLPAHIRLWDVATGKEIHTFGKVKAGKQKNAFYPQMLTFSRDGKLLAALGNEGKETGVLRLWHVADGKKSWRLQGQSKCMGPFLFSPDSKLLAEYTSGKIRLWQPATGKRIKEISYPFRTCEVIIFSPDGKRLAAGTSKAMQLWRLPAASVLTRLGRTWTLAFSPDGKTFVTLYYEELHIHDAQTGKQRSAWKNSFSSSQSLQYGYHFAQQGIGWPLAFSPDGKRLMVADQSNLLHCWDIAGQKEIVADKGTRQGMLRGLAFSPDHRTLVSAGNKGVALWDVHTRKLLRVLAKDSGHPKHTDEGRLAMLVRYSKDGRFIAAGWADGTITVWHAKTGKQLWHRYHPGPIGSLVFAPDDSRLVATDAQGWIFWYHSATGLLLRSNQVSPAPKSLLMWAEAFYVAPVLSADGRLAVATDIKGTVHVWETASGEIRQMMKNGESSSLRLFSPKNSYLIHQINDFLEVRDLENHSIRHIRTGTAPLAATFLPGGEHLAISSQDNSVSIWHAATGTFLGQFKELPCRDDSFVTAVTVSADNKLIASAGRYGTILLWDLASLLSSAKMTIREAQRTGLSDMNGPQAKQGSAKVSPPRSPRQNEKNKGKQNSDLPAGATARLGSRQFQHGDMVKSVWLLAGGKTLLSETMADGTTSTIHHWDLRSGKQLVRVKTSAPSSSGTWIMGLNGRPVRISYPLRDISSDGSLLATFPVAVSDKTCLRLVDLKTGKTIKDLDQSAYSVSMLKFAPDGNLLALVVIDDLAIRLVHPTSGLEAGKLTFARKDKDFQPTRLLYSPDGRQLVAVGDKGEKKGCVRLWNLNKLGLPRALPMQLNSKDALIFSPDGSQLVVIARTAKDSKTCLRFYDLQTGKLVRTLSDYSSSVSQLTFSPDGKMLAAVNDEGARFWQVDSGKELPSFDLPQAKVLVFSPDSKLLALASTEEIVLYDLVTCRQRHRFSSETLSTLRLLELEFNRRETPTSWEPAMAFSPDSKILFVADERVIRKWDVVSGKEIVPDNAQPLPEELAIAAAGRIVAVCSKDGVLLWDTLTRQRLRWLKTELPERKGAAANVSVNYYDLRLRAGQAGLDVDTMQAMNEPEPAKPRPTTLALAPSGKVLAVGYSSGHIVLWNPVTGKKLRLLDGHSSSIGALHFSSDSRKLFSADDEKYQIWDPTTGRKLRKTAKEATAVPTDSPYIVYNSYYGGRRWYMNRRYGVSRPIISPRNNSAFSPDGRLYATASQVVETGSGKFRVNLTQYGTQAPLVFSPDSQLLAHGSPAGVHLIDIVRRKKVRFFGHLESVTSAAFSPDGKLLAAAGTQGLMFWDIASGKVLARCKGHRGAAVAVAFSHDGRQLYSSGVDSTILIWNVASLMKQQRRTTPAAQEIPQLWHQLASDDAGKAWQATLHLRRQPQETVALLASKLHPVAAPDPQQVQKWIAQLDHTSFRIRSRAMNALGKFGTLTRSALLEAHKKNLSPEHQRRIEVLLAKLTTGKLSPQQLQTVRSIELLEHLAIPQARTQLQRLARGAPESFITRQAHAALQRLQTNSK